MYGDALFSTYSNVSVEVDGKELGFGDVMYADERYRKVKAIVDKIDLSRFPIKLHIEVRRGPCIFMRMTVPDRACGVSLPVWNDTYANYIRADQVNEAWITAEVRRIARVMVLLELDEMFMYDGKRPFDPHAPEPTPIMEITVPGLQGSA